ncbi:putative armadillo-like helical protein [Lupinus albus]|uniref:Putative armadillo-like helical protein n=1 Tax=Lupinus albus TaxID=3870 RepID=A0A6A4NSK5_LUPAL|nr:putative armadillo-like helical protein [Lupinus albus]
MIFFDLMLFLNIHSELVVFILCHIVLATLDNYDLCRKNEDADVRAESHHNWVDEVVCCEGWGASVTGNDIRSSCLIIQPRLEIKDPSLLTREEIEKPEIWAQICVQRVAEFANDSTTLRCVLDPMFVYFDSRKHWAPQKGLAMKVLSSMTYLMENSRNQWFIIASVIHHLDHKNVMNDPQLKACVVKVATSLAMQIRSGKGLAEIGFVGDLCRHLRKSLQASNELVEEEEELNLNILLQNSMEDCLLEIAKGIIDAQPLFDLMAITLDNMPSGVVARATIGSLIILARAATLALSRLHSQQGFPEALLIQLLKVMLHSDVEARVGAHLIFSVLICPSSFHAHGVSYLRSGCLDQHSKRRSHTASASASITALLEKLRRGRDDSKTENHGTFVFDGSKERDVVAENWKQGGVLKNSPNFYKLSSIMDRATGSSSLTDAEPYVMKLSEDQMEQLLSAFWIQANVPDNLPSNMEAIAHSFIITLMFLCTKKLKDRDNLVIRFFQLPLSLWSMSCYAGNAGVLHPTCQRAILVLSAGMLMFACKMYQIHDLNDVFTSLAIFEVDPFLGISDDYHVYAKVHVDIREYGTAADNQLAMTILSELRDKICECHKTIKDVLVQGLAIVTELDADDVATILSEIFVPDEEFVFGQQSILDQNQMIYHSLESLSFDGDFPSTSVIEYDTISETSVSDLARFIPKVPASPPVSHVISIGQLMESALEVAGQVAGTVVSTSPLPYNTMARQCETLGTCGRTKLSNWLAFENHYSQAADKPFLANVDSMNSELEKEANGGGHGQVITLPMDPWLAMKLPPTSPFDNFLKAAGC